MPKTVFGGLMYFSITYHSAAKSRLSTKVGLTATGTLLVQLSVTFSDDLSGNEIGPHTYQIHFHFDIKRGFLSIS
ncbi:hypothetical protein TNCT_15131 [Trichonephila clavata]|uniref:Uncharacterized protein n=1 Tax=Trichonephila clavata TaxID=2740835 RepID=A0A8X6FCN7_TRICU|nr:hypothetical protein TNCT_15131 [Trichonephila clavata]